MDENAESEAETPERALKTALGNLRFTKFKGPQYMTHVSYYECIAILDEIERLTKEAEKYRLDYEHIESVNRQIANERDEAIRREEQSARLLYQYRPKR